MKVILITYMVYFSGGYEIAGMKEMQSMAECESLRTQLQFGMANNGYGSFQYECYEVPEE